MENQSLTQEESTSNIAKRIEKREEILGQLKDNLNYIYIVIMILAQCLISLLKIDEEGKIILKYPSSTLGWILWIASILLITYIGVAILNSFRNQGIKNGHKVIQKTYNEYIDLITSDNKDSNPRGLKEYLRVNKLKDSISKGSIILAVNLLAVSASISANLNSILALCITIIFAVAFGIKALIEAEDYVLTELVVWYKKRINQLKLKRRDKNGKIQRD